MVKLIATILLSLALLSPVDAATAPNPTTKEATCPLGGVTYEQGLEDFDAKANSADGVFLAVKTFDDGSFASIWDFRASKDVNPETPFFVLIFDPDHCYVSSVWFNQQQVQDAFGVTFS